MCVCVLFNYCNVNGHYKEYFPDKFVNLSTVEGKEKKKNKTLANTHTPHWKQVFFSSSLSVWGVWAEQPALRRGEKGGGI